MSVSIDTVGETFREYYISNKQHQQDLKTRATETGHVELEQFTRLAEGILSTTCPAAGSFIMMRLTRSSVWMSPSVHMPDQLWQSISKIFLSIGRPTILQSAIASGTMTEMNDRILVNILQARREAHCPTITNLYETVYLRSSKHLARTVPLLCLGTQNT